MVKIEDVVDLVPKKFIHIILIVCSVAFFFDIFDLFVISSTLPAIENTFHLNSFDGAFTYSIGFVGLGIGALTGGFLADYLGRQKLLLITMSLIGASALLMAIAPDWVFLLVFRVLFGYGAGAELPIVGAYLNEYIPRKKRGYYYAIAIGIGWLSIPVVDAGGAFIIPAYSFGWRLVFVIGGIIALIFVYLRYIYLPESFRWLLKQNRRTDAIQVFKEIFKHYGREDTKILEQINDVDFIPYQKKLPYKVLFTKKNARITILLAIAWPLNFLLSYGVEGFLPTYLIDKGYSYASSLAFTAITTIGIIIAIPLGIFLADRFERKYLNVIFYLAAVPFALIFGLSSSLDLIIFAAIVIWLFQTMTGGNWLHLYSNEVFPTEARATGDGFTEAIGRFSTAGTLLIIPILYSSYGGIFTVFEFIAIVGVVISIVLAFGPKTNNLSLEEIGVAGK